MNKKTVITITLLVFFGPVFFSDILAWDNTVTHKDLSEFAAETSVLSKSKGDYLKNLGFNNALDEYFQWGNDNKKVRNWLREGAFLEDEGSYSDAVTGKARYTNHFHNPLKPCISAGLTDLQSGESSVLWAQDSGKQAVSLGGDWSWQKIRLCYYNALTVQKENDRQAFFACTFKGLGYQIHLIQDASQPAHVRNDAHPADGMGGVLGMMEGFETWAKKNYVKINSFASPPAFPMVSLAISYGGYVPITQFIDTDQYYGENPSSSSGLGLSEYTNANFVSDDTIFTENKGINHKHYFPYPRYSTNSYEMYEVDHSLITKRLYLRKKGDGESIEHFATAGPMFKFLSFDPVLQKSELKLDPAVYEDYASKLIPRAVGYSAGLLDYFFRGEIDLVPDDTTGSGYVIENDSEEDMNGTFELWYDNENDERKLVKSWSLSIGKKSSGNNKSANITFTQPTDAKNFCKYILVFKGQMGQEQDAVVGEIVYTDECYLWAVLTSKNRYGWFSEPGEVKITFRGGKTIGKQLPVNIENIIQYKFAEGNPFIFGILSVEYKYIDNFGSVPAFYKVDLFEINKDMSNINYLGEVLRIDNSHGYYSSNFGYMLCDNFSKALYSELEAKDLFISNDGKIVNIIGSYKKFIGWKETWRGNTGNCESMQDYIFCVGYPEFEFGYFINEKRYPLDKGPLRDPYDSLNKTKVNVNALNPDELFINYANFPSVNSEVSSFGYYRTGGSYGGGYSCSLIGQITWTIKYNEETKIGSDTLYSQKKTMRYYYSYGWHNWAFKEVLEDVSSGEPYSLYYVLTRDKGVSVSLKSTVDSQNVVSYSSEKGFFCPNKEDKPELINSYGERYFRYKTYLRYIGYLYYASFSPRFKECFRGVKDTYTNWDWRTSISDITFWRNWRE